MFGWPTRARDDRSTPWGAIPRRPGGWGFLGGGSGRWPSEPGALTGPRGGWVLAAALPWLLLAAALALVFARLRQSSAVLPLWRPWAEVGALACGMTAIILTGGIDLSVGSVVALCGVVL